MDGRWGAIEQGDFARRLGVTAVALALFHAGGAVPLSGLDPKTVLQLYSTGTSAVPRISIFALSLIPFVNVLIIAELAKLAVPSLRAWERGSARNREQFNGMVVTLALLAAAPQAYGLAMALEQVTPLVSEPGLGFRLSCVTTIVSATALLIWLSDQITRDGIGSGVWLLYAVPALADTPYRVLAIADLHSRYGVSTAQILLAAAFTAVATGAIAGLMLANRDTLRVGRALLWPTLLAFTALPWCLAIGSYASGDTESFPLFDKAHPARLIVLAGLLALFSYLWARRNGPHDETGESALLAGALLVAVALAGEVFGSHLGVPLPLDAPSLIVITVVAVSVLAALKRLPS